MVSHRVTFEYDSGSKVVGYVASCLPRAGAVQMLVLSKVAVFDGSKNVSPRYDELPLVPNNLVGFKITKGPALSTSMTPPPRAVDRRVLAACAGPNHEIVEDRFDSRRRRAARSHRGGRRRGRRRRDAGNLWMQSPDGVAVIGETLWDSRARLRAAAGR